MAPRTATEGRLHASAVLDGELQASAMRVRVCGLCSERVRLCGLWETGVTRRRCQRCCET